MAHLQIASCGLVSQVHAFSKLALYFQAGELDGEQAKSTDALRAAEVAQSRTTAAVARRQFHPAYSNGGSGGYHRRLAET